MSKKLSKEEIERLYPFRCPECKRRTNSEKKFVAHLTQHHDWSAAAAMNLANQIIIDIKNCKMVNPKPVIVDKNHPPTF